VIGLTPNVFLFLTPRQFFNLHKGFEIKEKEKEHRFRLQSELQRLQITQIYNALCGESSSVKSPTEFLPFSWDQPVEAKEKHDWIEEEEADKLLKAWG